MSLGKQTSPSMGTGLWLNIAVAAWRGTGLERGLMVQAPNMATTISVDDAHLKESEAYIEAHYLPMGGYRINPRAVIALQNHPGTGVLLHTTESRHFFQVREFKEEEGDRLIRESGLTYIGRGMYISMADTASFTNKSVWMASGKDFPIVLDHWPDMVLIAEAANWSELKDPSSWVNPSEVVALINDTVFYRGGFQHQGEDLTEEGVARLINLPWFVVEEHQRIVLSHVNYVGPIHGGTVQHVGLYGSFSLPLTKERHTELILAIGKHGREKRQRPED